MDSKENEVVAYCPIDGGSPLCTYKECHEQFLKDRHECCKTTKKNHQVFLAIQQATKKVNPFSGNSLQWDHMVALEAIRLLASRLSCHRPLKTDEKELLNKLGVKI